MRENRFPARSYPSITTHRVPHSKPGGSFRTQGLRERLIGAWKLVSYVEKPVDGSARSRACRRSSKNVAKRTTKIAAEARLPRAFVGIKSMYDFAAMQLKDVL